VAESKCKIFVEEISQKFAHPGKERRAKLSGSGIHTILMVYEAARATVRRLRIESFHLTTRLLRPLVYPVFINPQNMGSAMFRMGP